MRFLLALLLSALVCVPGALVVEALNAGSAGALAVLILAMFIGSLADRETFYGIEPRPK